MTTDSFRERRERLGLSYSDLEKVGFGLAERVETGRSWGRADAETYGRVLSWLESRTVAPQSDRCRIAPGGTGYVNIEALDDPYASDHAWSCVARVDTDGFVSKLYGSIDPVTCRFVSDVAASLRLQVVVDSKREKTKAVEEAQKNLEAARAALAAAEREWETARQDAGLY